LKSESKNDLIRELASVVASSDNRMEHDVLTEKLIDRESLSSTGIGDGIAIPHCKYENINGIIMAYGRSVSGRDFDSINKQPVHHFFLIVAPNTQQAAGEHLRTLAKITRMLKDDEFKRSLLSAEDKKEIFKLISEEDAKY
ncbi:PTS sugar transporter subunit IIA, partial [Thermodesulfobacteriota bacterium]